MGNETIIRTVSLLASGSPMYRIGTSRGYLSFECGSPSFRLSLCTGPFSDDDGILTRFLRSLSCLSNLETSNASRPSHIVLALMQHAPFKHSFHLSMNVDGAIALVGHSGMHL